VPRKNIQVITWNRDGSKTSEFVELDLPSYEPVRDFWCECDEAHETTYHPDEYDDEGMRIDKHHHTCNHCGKVTQIG